MSDPEKPTVIVIKRITKKSAHHGGSWKIAYADFVTAMMAFFMLMWLLSMLNKHELQGISNYFKRPLKGVVTEGINVMSKAGKNESAPNKTKSLNGGLPDKKENHLKNIADQKSIDKEKNKAEAKRKENEELKQLKQRMEAALKENPEIYKYKDQLNFKVTRDGLKIEITSLKGVPMFSKGKMEFEKYASDIIKSISKELNANKKRITIIGHTDTDVYSASEKYSNWELSADRANAARRLLIQSGIDSDRFVRVQGAGSSDLLYKKDGKNPANRRIEIIILTNEATSRFLKE